MGLIHFHTPPHQHETTSTAVTIEVYFLQTQRKYLQKRIDDFVTSLVGENISIFSFTTSQLKH